MFKPTDDFITILDKCITIDLVKSLPKREYKGVHLSELGCPREYMFKVFGYRGIPDPEGIRALDSGTSWHNYIQGTLIRNGVVLPDAVELALKSKVYELDSNTDIGFMEIQGEIYLIDFKTIRCNKGSWDKYGFEGIVSESKEHRRQVTLYIYFINEMLRGKPVEYNGRFITEIKKGLIVYIRKDGGVWRNSRNFNRHNIPFDEGFRNKLQEMTDYELVFSPRNREQDLRSFVIHYDELEALLYVKQVEKLDELVKEYLTTGKKNLPPPKKEKDYYCERLCSFPELCEKGVI